MTGLLSRFVPLAAASMLIVPTAAAAVPPTAQAQTAVQSLLQSPNHPLPVGTRLLGLSVQDGVAVVNFNKAFTNNFQGGDSQAADTVNTVLRVLGRVPNINKVQFLENGQAPDSMGGLIVLSSPLVVIPPQEGVQTLYYHRHQSHLSAHRGKVTQR